MRANAQKRKIFDAVDMLTGESPVQAGEMAAGGVQMLSVDKIKAFHDHPFRLYEGQRLDDMVESIKEHGVLNPVIVRKAGRGYEMLSGHNRQNAAKIAGLAEIPAIVKEGISDEEAYIYVIETNLMQRSFADLLPSERATVMEAHYNKVCCQGRRNDIIRELQIMNGEMPSETCGHNGHKFKSRDALAEEYGYSSRNVARYLRINSLIRPFKNLADDNRIALLAAVDVSYLSEEEQGTVYQVIDEMGVKLKPKMAGELRKQGGALDRDTVENLIGSIAAKKLSSGEDVQIKLSDDIRQKYFVGMSAAQMAEVVEQALEAWFLGKEDVYVQQ